MKSEASWNKIVVYASRGLLAVLSLKLLWLAIFRDHHLDYNEANTLKVSFLSLSEISRIFHVGQNFPLYYLILHLLQTPVVMGVFHFLAWLGTVLIARKIFRFFVQETAHVELLTLAFAAVPYVFHYSFFFRMYGLTNLSLAIQTYCLLYVAMTDSNSKLIWISRGLQIFVTLFHPIGISISIVTSVLDYLVSKPRKMLIPFGFIFLDLVCAGLQLATKTNLQELFMGSGVSYIEMAKVGLLVAGPVYFSHSFFNFEFVDIPLFAHATFYILLALAIAALCTSAFAKDRRLLIVGLPASLFFLVPIVLSRTFAPHHNAFFLVPASLLLLLGAYFAILNFDRTWALLVSSFAILFACATWHTHWTFEKVTPHEWTLAGIVVGVLVFLSVLLKMRILPGRYGLWPAVFSIVFGSIYLMSSSWALVALHENDAALQKRCDFLKNLPAIDGRTLVMTQYTSDVIVDSCLARSAGSAEVALADGARFLPLEGLSPFDRLQTQILVGGDVRAFSGNIMSDLETQPKIAEFIQSFQPDRIIFFYSQLHCDMSLSEGTGAFAGFHQQKCQIPQVISYERKKESIAPVSN